MAQAHGINSEGLRRRGYSAGQIAAIRRAYRTLYKSGHTLQEAIAALRAEASAEVALLAAFLEGVSRGIVR